VERGISKEIGREFLIALPYNVIFCSVIAILFTLFSFAPKGEPTSFFVNLLYSQCIGNLCCLFCICAHNFFNKTITLIIGHGIALCLGTISGTLLASFILGSNPLFFVDEYLFFLKILFGTLIFGSIIVYFWHLHQNLVTTKTIAQEERIRRLSSEKETIEANLKLLQAQIEPHFLFNTLSNILLLLETDIEKGKAMLADLSQYLRTSLSIARKEVSTLGQEMDMIRGYLKIFKVRMGIRLTYRIEIPEDLRNIPMPPMLIQPLVENAIRHGLESKVGGGAIDISARKNENTLAVTIADTGLGMQDGHDPGTGLNNIRQRLLSLYGDRGRLILRENDPSGVTATIEVPHAFD
jgi:sensor histidine kinase YesM